MNQERLDKTFLGIAWTVAEILSKDPNTKVGAVIVTPDYRQISIGYNGMPIGLDETKEIWERPLKHEYVIHAEKNSVLNAPFDTKDCIAYITHRPCHKCLGELRNARIDKIVYDLDYSNINLEVWENLAKLFSEVRQFPFKGIKFSA